jgi:hypothetical protein
MAEVDLHVYTPLDKPDPPLRQARASSRPWTWKHSSISLVRCRGRDSRLLQLLEVVGSIDGSSVVARYCPDCERSGTVVAEHAAVEVWLRRDERIASWMTAAADELAGVLARSGVGVQATRRPP